MYSRLNWSTLRQTHPRRSVPVSACWSDDRTHLPEQTPVVGDQIRYVDPSTENEVSPLSALGYVRCGIRIEYETYGDAS
jgi:hypothetical protein